MDRLKRWRLRLNNRVVAWVSVAGVGLLPCPDCGIPLGVKIWPVAGVIWLYWRLRRRGEAQLDLLITNELSAHTSDASSHDSRTGAHVPTSD